MPRPQINASITINLSPEDLYDFALGDLDSMPDWMTSVDSIESYEGKWPEVGSSHVYVRKFGEQERRGRTTIAETDRPHRVVMSELVDIKKPTTNPRDLGRTTWRFEPDGEGTRMTITLEGADLNPIVYLLFKLAASKSVSTNIQKSLATLKRISESELEDAQ